MLRSTMLLADSMARYVGLALLGCSRIYLLIVECYHRDHFENIDIMSLI